MITTKEGKPSSTSPHNAEKVWTQHPHLRGRTRINLHTGEVEVVGPPWAFDQLVTGSRSAALDCATWLERSEKMSLSPKVLDEVLRSEIVSPVINTVEQPGEWDGAPAIGRMLQDVPLDAPHEQVLRLWEILFSDLEAKFAGELHAQRYVLGVVTEKNVNLARAIVGEYGAVHAGVVTEAHLLDWARRNLLVVQVEMRTVADERRSLRSMQNLMQPDAWSRAEGRSLPTPLIIAVGPWSGDKRVLEKTSDGCLPLRLTGPVLEDASAADAQAALAEARARRDELRLLKAPSREQILTVDEAHRIEAVSAMLWAIYYYATKALPLDRPLDPAHVLGAGARDTPLWHIVREQFLTVMKPTLVGTWRTDDVMGFAFNAACRAMGWRNKLGVTPKIAAQLQFTLPFGDRPSMTIPGCLLDEERVENLRDKLSDDDDPLFDLPPKGGGLASDLAPDLSPPLATVSPPQEIKQTAALAVLPEANTHARGKHSNVCIARGRGRAYESPDKSGTARRWLEGPEAVAAVQTILAEPGAVGLDVETWPTDPAWHGEQAAANAPRGKKGEAKERATMEARKLVRAHKRQACTLQLHHADGAEAFIRLTDPARELPAMFEPITGAAPWDDPPTLVAFGAQFETEVLLKHGVALDVECAQLATKCLLLVAVGEESPQPVEFSLAVLVEREFGRKRDKHTRDRDWRLEASLVDEAVEYGLQDARDALELWQLYERRLRDEGLLDGYRVMQGALLPTAACNLAGLPLDAAAHDVLMGRLQREAATLGRDLDRLCDRRVVNHGSTPQVSTWIMEEVLDEPIKRPEAPKVVGLFDFLRSKGGLRPDQGGELAARDVPKSLLNLAGLSLNDASVAAQEHGYLGLDRTTMGEDATSVGEDDLLAAIDDELAGRRVLPLDQRGAWDAHLAESERWAAGYRDDHRMSRFVMRLRAKAGVGWRTTKTGHLAVTKGAKLRKAEQLREAFPRVSAYLIKHAQWNRATKLLDSFGPTLRRWVDDADGHARGQARVFAAWTGRQSCVDPNLQNQPRETEFRALWIAKPGRKLVIADYDQVELRLLAIESGDEVMRQIYREGRDVHREVASIAFGIPFEAVTKELRRRAKAISFGIAYGSGAAGLAEHGGFELDEAHTILARVLAAYPGLATYRERMPREAEQRGSIAIRPHRRVAYDPSTSAGTQAVNAPIQGGAASVQMRALRLTWDALRASGIDAKLAVSVHDEIILDCSEAAAAEAAELLVNCMTQALVEIFPEAEDQGLSTLTAASVADRWSERA